MSVRPLPGRRESHSGGGKLITSTDPVSVNADKGRRAIGDVRAGAV